jgi:hypothetical protein
MLLNILNCLFSHMSCLHISFCSCNLIWYAIIGYPKKLVEFQRVLTVVHCTLDQFISSHVSCNQNQCHVCQTKKPWFSTFILSPLTVCK